MLSSVGPETYSELCQTYKIGLFVIFVDGWKLLIIFSKSSILDVWQYASKVYIDVGEGSHGKFPEQHHWWRKADSGYF